MKCEKCGRELTAIELVMENFDGGNTITKPKPYSFTGGMLFDTSCEAYDEMAELVWVAEVDYSTDWFEGTFLGEESDTTTMKFKPVCERCGYTLSSLSLRGNTSSGYMREWHFQPFSCPWCGRRIVTAELPHIKAEEIDYTE